MFVLMGFLTVHCSYRVHVDAIGVSPGVLEVLLQPLPEWIWNLVKADKLLNTQHLRVVASRP